MSAGVQPISAQIAAKAAGQAPYFAPISITGQFVANIVRAGPKAAITRAT